jgi:AraC-like DNA-binding protein
MSRYGVIICCQHGLLQNLLRLDSENDVIATDIARVPIADGSIDLVSADCTAHRFRPHFHADLALGVIATGKHRLRCASGTYVVNAGDIVVLNAGEVHNCESLDGLPWGYRMFYVPDWLVRDLVAGSDRGPPGRVWFRSAVVRDPPFARRLAALHQELRSPGGLAWRAGFMSALREFTIQYAGWRRAPVEPAGPRPHERVRAYLEAHYAEPIRIAEVCRITGISLFHLIRGFKEAVGLPPGAYLSQVRIARAQGMLRSGCPIATVARATAFSDQSHFTRRFKETLGFPPGAYLRAVRLGSVTH